MLKNRVRAGCRPYFWSCRLSFCLYLNFFVGLRAVDQNPAAESGKGIYVGCFSENIDLYEVLIFARSADSCVELCEKLYFRYAVLSFNKCACANLLEENPLEQTICNTRCAVNKSQFCGGVDAQSYYDTGVKVSGPPRDVRFIPTDSESVISLQWNKAQQSSYVTNYKIKANVVQTFANYPLNRLFEWTVEKDEIHAELIDLQPGTIYNISISSMCGTKDGGTAYVIAETKIGKPTPAPVVPTVINRTDTTMIVDIPPGVNNNGPITYYRVIVMFVDDSLQHEFDETLLGSYNQSIEDGTPYYITAELEYQNNTRRFTIGNGKKYREYFNAPLPSDSHVHISLGVVSIYKGIIQVAYAIGTHEQHTKTTEAVISDDSESSIVALSVACVLLGLLLIASFFIYCYLRLKTGNRLQRLSDNHELTLQGPMVEVENNGYVPDDQRKGNFRDQLNSILENLDNSQKFARNAMRLNIDNVLAQGNFGDVISGKLYTNSDSYDCQVHVISDDMESQDQAIFLKDLEQLVRIMPNEKFVNFFGVSASPDWFYLIFELPAMLLKKRLVEARVPPSVDSTRFSSVSEEMILQWIYDISEAMEYLEVNKVSHKQLCSYNVYITQLNQVKINLFGPTRFNEQEKPIDISRWLAPEVLRFQHHSTKSDVWSFACLAWECCTLGATLYANITSQDLLPRIKNGGRPDQPAFVYSDLYQLFLNCWQLEPSERPDFEEVAFNVRQALTSPRHCLSFDRFDNIFIPYYLPLLEMKN